MLTGSPTVYSQDRERLYRNIRNADPKLNYPYLSENAKDIMKQLLIKNPEERMGSRGIDEIKEHPWF